LSDGEGACLKRRPGVQLGNFDLYKICEEAAKIISGNNFNITEIASLLNEQWKIKKALSTFVSNQKINHLYDYALRSGALSGKILGAGGGGFFLFLSRNRFEKKKLISNLSKYQHVNFNYDYEGSKVVYETN
jgi:D-glycero-alpha-D-manno-heptose-7-phosphate kinase